MEFSDVSILEERRTFEERFKSNRREVSKTISPGHVPREDDGALDTTTLSKAVDGAPLPIVWPNRSRNRH